MAVALQGKWPDALGPIALQGGDKAQHQIAYRLVAGPEKEDPVYFWLSVFDPQGQPSVSLLKTGVGTYDDEPVPALTYHDWQLAAGYRWPHRKVFVKGLVERPGDEIRTRQVTAADVTDAAFRMPEP
jgi:hypothetical protein